jgi:hypothetical protein
MFVMDSLDPKVYYDEPGKSPSIHHQREFMALWLSNGTGPP